MSSPFNTYLSKSNPSSNNSLLDSFPKNKDQNYSQCCIASTLTSSALSMPSSGTIATDNKETLQTSSNPMEPDVPHLMKTLVPTKSIPDAELGHMNTDMLQSLSSSEPPSHFQGLNGAALIGDALPLDIYEQYLETLGGLLGCQLPAQGLPYLPDAPTPPICGVNQNDVVPAPESPQFVDSIKQMLISQQESIVSLLKAQLKNLSVNTVAQITQEKVVKGAPHGAKDSGRKPRRNRRRSKRRTANRSPWHTIEDVLSRRENMRKAERAAYSPAGRSDKGDTQERGVSVTREGKGSSPVPKPHAKKAAIKDFDALTDIVRSSQCKRLRLEDCVGFFRQMSTQPHCSRALQEMIKVATQAQINMICGEIIPFMGEMVLHPCGNYVIQNLITHGDKNIKKGLFEMLKNNMMYLTEDVCGCRVAQAAIQHFDEDDSAALASELDGNLTECIRSRNGNHVVQACIVHLPASRLGFMMDFFVDKVKHLAVHPFGCRVLQRILEHCSDEKAKSKVIEAIIKDSEILATDQYGNYILQHALVHGNAAERTAIVQRVSPKVVSLSCHKYASNAVEKCLAKGSTGDVNLLISDALTGETGEEGVRRMAKDRFGNYVVQRMLKMADEAQRKDITSRLDPVEVLQSSPFGRPVAGLLDRMEMKTLGSQD